MVKYQLKAALSHVGLLYPSFTREVVCCINTDQLGETASALFKSDPMCQMKLCALNFGEVFN